MPSPNFARHRSTARSIKRSKRDSESIESNAGSAPGSLPAGPSANDEPCADRQRHTRGTCSFSVPPETKTQEPGAKHSSASKEKKRADGDSRRDGCLSEEDSQKTTTVTDALLSFVHQHDPSVFVRGASRAETDPSCGASPPDSADADERVGVQNTSEDDDGESRCECADPLCGASPPDASLVRETLRACVMVVGMHSDQATEWIVDFALAHRVRFAVVPCCVCPGLFPRRRRVDGSGAPVRSHAEFCEYLRAKARPGEIELARLPFEGKNTVVYSAFDAKGGRGYRDRR